MVPTKIKMGKVGNDRAKRLSFKKRKDCVLRKTMELAVLCDIKACAVVFGPDGEVETWPENPRDLKALIHNYKEYDHDHPGKKQYLRQEIFPKKDDNDNWLDRLSGQRDLLKVIECKLETVRNRVEFLKVPNTTEEVTTSEYYFDPLELDIQAQATSTTQVDAGIKDNGGTGGGVSLVPRLMMEEIKAIDSWSRVSYMMDCYRDSRTGEEIVELHE
ncbi:unnamed protein product [Ilex paraguariensis]|uniref:MADS-box domain-containing protein n=1 Tax=Ilex paraguariensis TaxID=185542 RepID=A0ABC8V0Z3_9AQUA